jgi:spore maturation protein CgeB
MELKNHKLRIVRLIGLTSKSFVQESYLSNPALQFQDVLEQQKFFFESDSVFNDYFDIRMRELGFECQSVIHDVQIIRDAWIGASDSQLTGNSDLDFLLAVIRTFDANVVFEQSAGLLDKQMILKLKSEIPEIALFATHIASPVNFENYSEHDLVFVGCESYVKPMKSAGCKNVFLLRHGFDTRLESKYRSTKRLIDVSFVGNSGFRNPSYWSRYQYLDQLSRDGLLESWSTPAETSGEDYRKSWTRVFHLKIGALVFNIIKLSFGLVASVLQPVLRYQFIRKCFGSLSAKRLDKYSSDYKLRRLVSFPLIWRFPQVPFYIRDKDRSNPQVFGSAMLSLLANSKITFHRRADLVDGCAGAMRLFEATGMGALLLTDDDSDICSVFEPGIEVVTYTSYQDCVDKIKYYLEHESERERIALKGQERTFNDHSLNARYTFVAEQILKQFRNE